MTGASVIRTLLALSAVAAFAGGSSVVHGAPPPIVSGPLAIPLTFEGPPGLLGPSGAFGVNEEGTVVGWYRWFSQTRAFRWNPATGPVDLGPGVARRINAAGLIAGHEPFESSVPRAYVWEHDRPTLLTNGQALDVNDRGQVVGWIWPPSHVYSAFLWPSTDGVQDLGTLLGFGFFAGFSQALGITDSGLVVGWSVTAESRPHAIRWTAATGMVDLGAPAGPFSMATDANRHEQIVGGAGTDFDQTRAVSWTPRGGWTMLPDLGGFSLATAVNSFGQIAGWAETADGVRHAVVWLRHGELLDLGPGEAHDISDGGQVVGSSGTPNGPRAVQWQLAPAARGRAVGLGR